MFAFRIVFAACAALIGTSALAADEQVVATARTRLPTAAEAEAAKAAADAERTIKPAETKEQVIASLAAAPQIKRTDPSVYDHPSVDDEIGPRQVHGVVSVSVGTGGYRSGYVASIIPLGENGTLGLAYSQTDYGKNNVYGYGYGYDDYYDGYYDGYYGDGYYDRGHYPYVRRGGKSQSLAISLDMSSGDRGVRTTSENCAPGFRAGDEYIEPLWVTRMRGNRSCLSGGER